jgi:outer membrane lipoprotein carrier protein
VDVPVRSSTLFAALAFVAVTAATQAPDQQAAALARTIQERYQLVRDFSADFVHAYKGGVLGKQVTERGTVLISKPGRMRWTYTAPEKKVFVSDGRQLYSYIPEDKQVIISRVPGDDEAGSASLFLAGKGNVTRDFTPSLVTLPNAPPGTQALKLVPKNHEQDYEWLVLVVDKDTLRLRLLVTADQQGGESTFIFSNLKENVGVPEKAFTFEIPRGVDVIRQQ